MPGPLAKALIEGLGLKAGNNPFSGMGLATAGLSTDHNFFNLKMPNPFKKDATKESGYSYNGQEVSDTLFFEAHKGLQVLLLRERLGAREVSKLKHHQALNDR